jgi:hypothetical protein
LHNHNSAGTAKGSMERALDIAGGNLDFYAFTGQSQWHDMQEYANNVHLHWLKGFAEHARQWPDNVKLLEAAYVPGKFVTFIGYEWHSSAHGDYNLIFPGSEVEFALHPTIENLRQWAERHHAVLIPHHLGYPTGGRGANWNTFDESRSPVVEIFSEHGCCERDEGPFPYIRHGIGSRMTRNTFQYALNRGFHVGAIAGTDNHIGFPGGYGEGLTAVLAPKLDRTSIWDALWNRRVYAVTGDRIKLDFQINGYDMGQTFTCKDRRLIHVEADCWDRIHMIEVIKNNQIIHRHFVDRNEQEQSVADCRKWKCRIEFGWGPWGDLNIARICDWDMQLSVKDGTLLDVCPCFGSGPFDEERRSKITAKDEESCEWVSYTRRQGAFEERPNGIVFEIEGKAPQLSLDLRMPVTKRINKNLVDLIEENDSEFVSGFQSEMVLFHRAVPSHEYRTQFQFVDEQVSNVGEDFYYVRVTQDNGQMAWSSPIWVRSFLTI